jgi:aspartyl-tRNA(Asn)/glutamyl-tRNA(Gln) amidotransferase subunit C
MAVTMLKERSRNARATRAVPVGARAVVVAAAGSVPSRSGMAGLESEVRQVARLAHLALDDDEVREAATQLRRLLAYVEQIAAIDVSGVQADAACRSDTEPLRPDVARPGLPRDVIMSQAPAAAAGLFEVPRVIGPGDGA